MLEAPVTGGVHLAAEDGSLRLADGATLDLGTFFNAFSHRKWHALTGLTRSLSLDGREYDIACGQIDIGNAATTRNEDTARGRLQASGKVEAEARIDVNDVARGVAYMASLSLEANVQFMTVMATKMPYIGRG